MFITVIIYLQGDKWKVIGRKLRNKWEVIIEFNVKLIVKNPSNICRVLRDHRDGLDVRIELNWFVK